MPFIFVHGVNNRRSADYDREEKIRAAFLREIVAPVVGIEPGHRVFAPYWGGVGVGFWNDLKVIPQGGGIEVFGDGNDLPPSLGMAVADAAVHDNDTLDAVARRQPGVAIDLLFDSAIQAAGTDEEIRAMAKAYRLAQERLENTAAPWLANSTQVNLLGQVLEVLDPVAPQGVESYGGAKLWDMLKEGAGRLRLLGPDQLSHVVVKAARRPLTSTIATFIGDSYRYIAERGDGSVPGPIASIVIEELQEAAKIARDTGEPLVVICHSFGGEIVYDVLTHYAEQLMPDLKVDTWVTIGSQVGLFEEMSLLWSSPGRQDPKKIPQQAIAPPRRVGRWLNIVDTNDVLGFLVQPVFAGTPTNNISDFVYNTGYPVTGAHSGYFKWPSFYKRLASRIKES